MFLGINRFSNKSGGESRMFLSIFNWIGSLFGSKDDSFIGLSRLNNAEKYEKPAKVIKKSKELKISDLMKGETF